MPSDTTMVGNVTITTVSDGTYYFDPASFFPGVPAGSWAAHPDALDAQGRLVLNVGSFLLRSEGLKILVDTGLGPAGINPRADSGELLDSMRNAGVPPEDLDLVVTTHVHPDHVGWNFSGEPGSQRMTFPNARYVVPRIDWDSNFNRPEAERTALFRDQVEPLQALGRLQLVDDGSAVTSDISIVATPGHTPGHSCIGILSGGERAYIAGDLVHAPFQVRETAWSSRADADRETAIRSREAMLDRAEREEAVYAAGHFPHPGLGRLVRVEGRRYWHGLG